MRFSLLVIVLAVVLHGSKAAEKIRPPATVANWCDSDSFLWPRPLGISTYEDVLKHVPKEQLELLDVLTPNDRSLLPINVATKSIPHFSYLSCSSVDQKIAKYITIPNIRFLDLHYSEFGPELRKVISNSTAISISLPEKNLSDADVEEMLAQSNAFPELVHLELPQNGQITARSVIRAIRHCRKLESIGFIGTPSDESIRAIEKSNIKGIRLYNADITEKLIANIINTNHVNHLAIDRCRGLNQGVIKLLSESKVLIELQLIGATKPGQDLSWDEAMELLNRNRTVETLVLESGSLSVRGLKAIEQIRQLRTIVLKAIGDDRVVREAKRWQLAGRDRELFLTPDLYLGGWVHSSLNSEWVNIRGYRPDMWP